MTNLDDDKGSSLLPARRQQFKSLIKKLKHHLTYWKSQGWIRGCWGTPRRCQQDHRRCQEKCKDSSSTNRWNLRKEERSGQQSLGESSWQCEGWRRRSPEERIRQDQGGRENRRRQSQERCRIYPRSGQESQQQGRQHSRSSPRQCKQRSWRRKRGAGQYQEPNHCK